MLRICKRVLLDEGADSEDLIRVLAGESGKGNCLLESKDIVKDTMCP